jgi:pantothenate kinase type III
MRSEINETIARYLQHNENLTIYLTGGDASHFENAIKVPIFADSNLTLFGLKLILEANV